MPLPDTDKWTVEIRLNGVMAAKGSDAKNTTTIFHFRRNGNGNPLSKAHINAQFDNAITSPFCDLLNVRWTGETEDIRFLEDAEDQYETFTPMVGGVQAVGTVTGDSLASLMTVYHNWRTPVRSKNFRGNKKIGPLSESDTTSATADVLNAGAYAFHLVFAAAVIGGFTDSDLNVWRPVVVSKTLSQLRTNPTDVRWNSVTQVLVNKRIGRMKRREVKSVY